MKIEKFIDLTLEYIQLLLKSWWILLIGFVPNLVDTISIYICPYFPTLCPDIFPRFLPLAFIGSSFLIANIRIFAEQKKKIEMLKTSLHKLKQSIPNLELSFPNGKKNCVFGPTIYVKKTGSGTEPKITKASFNKKLPEPLKGIQQTISALTEAIRLSPFYTQFQEETGYKNKLEEWKRKIKSYSEVEIKIHNNGNVPAHNIDVCLNFPKAIIPSEELPEKPEAPSMFPHSIGFTPRLNIDFDFWASVEGNTVNLHGKKLKHGHEGTFERFYLMTKETKRITKKVRYEITADNIPQPQKGALTFKITPRKVE